MRYETTVVLHAADQVNYSESVVEAILDALYDLSYIDDVDAVGSLASRNLEVTMVVHATDFDEATGCFDKAIREALLAVGGEIVEKGAIRKTSTETRELEPA